jgi:sugar O-acyltransferase (sialic acid O-acetyltransferase NeuD family)
MGRQVVIFGTGSMAELLDFYLTHDSPHDVVAFTATGPVEADEFRGRPLVPFETVEETHPADGHAMFVAVGYRKRNRLRAKFYGEAKAKGYDLVSYVSSRASIWEDWQVGENCSVFEGATIAPFAEIGNDVCVWNAAHVGHHGKVADHCFFAPRATMAGFVTMDERAFVGAGATIRDGVHIAAGTLIGAGAVVLRDTEPDEVYTSGRDDG